MRVFSTPNWLGVCFAPYREEYMVGFPALIHEAKYRWEL
jgi:hypothetical protein